MGVLHTTVGRDKERTVSKRWLAAVALTIFLVVTASGAALAAEFAGDETYRLAAGEIVEDDLYVAATEIYIDGTVKGDLIAAGGYIEIGATGTVEGDLGAVGAGIVVKGAVQDDLRAAGAGIELVGTVGDDAFLAGGGGQIAFPVWTGTRSIDSGLRIAGEVGGDAVMLGGVADIAGTIGGNADIIVSELRIDESARIGGTLSYTTAEQQEFPAGVASDIRFEESVADGRTSGTDGRTSGTDEGTSGTIVGAILGWILRTVAILVGVVIVGWLLIRFAPNALTRPLAAIRAKPLETGLYGLGAAVLFVFIPIVSIALVAFFWTFWGVFSGIIMFVFLFASLALIWFLSPLLTGFWLGDIISARLSGDLSPLMALLIGALLIVVLGRIPFLGWVVYLLSFALTLGGLLRSAWQREGQSVASG